MHGTVLVEVALVEGRRRVRGRRVGRDWSRRHTGVGDKSPDLFYFSPRTVAFGAVLTGSSSVQKVVTVTNISSGTVVMSGIGGGVNPPFSALQNCQGRTLARGQTCQMLYTFSPTATGKASTKSLGSWNGQSYSIPLKGTGVVPTFKLSPKSVAFGSVLAGSSSAQKVVTVTNTSPGPVVMSGIGGGASPPFSALQNCQGRTLTSGQTCQMFYTFSPTATGNASTIAVGSWNGQSYSISLRGKGVAPSFKFSPKSVDLGPVAVGTTSPQGVVTVTNTSPGPVVMAGIGGGASPPFSALQNCQGRTLTTGQTCQMFYTFSPTATGYASTKAIGSWNGQTYSIALKGFGF